MMGGGKINCESPLEWTLGAVWTVAVFNLLDCVRHWEQIVHIPSAKWEKGRSIGVITRVDPRCSLDCRVGEGKINCESSLEWTLGAVWTVEVFNLFDCVGHWEQIVHVLAAKWEKGRSIAILTVEVFNLFVCVGHWEQIVHVLAAKWEKGRSIASHHSSGPSVQSGL
ncbi:hypothetical protein J6590_067579 [Homalodisca vitripennis]|nr:hypothetical protein J6590_067579 [Homalodisca vitripennis]